MFINIKKYIYINYKINIYFINFLKRPDINYENLLDRKVYIVNKNLICKQIFSENINLSYIFRFIKSFNFTHVIYPIYNIKGGLISKGNNYIFLLFKKYTLININKYDFNDVFLHYKVLFKIINKMNKKYIINKYVSDFISFLNFIKQNNFSDFLLNKYNINKKEFYLYLLIYSYILKSNKNFNIIYSSFWFGNIYKVNNKIYFLDIDSIKIGDSLYDMVSIINLVYKFHKSDIKNRYKLYNEISDFFISDFKKNIGHIKGVFYYYSFRVITEINKNKKETLKCIHESCICMNDYFEFIKIK